MISTAPRLRSVPVACLLVLAVLAPGCDKGGTPRSTAPTSAAPAPGSSPAAERQTVTFGDLVPAVGMQRQRQKSMVTNLTMHVVAGDKAITMPIANAEFDNRREEILELDGSNVTKLLVTYDAREKRETASEGDEVEPSPVAGKSYVVALAGGKVTATRKGKGKTPQAEREVVEKDYRRLGEESPICKHLRARPPAVGDAVDVDESELALTGGGSSRLTITLRDVAQQDGKEWARFDAKVTMSGPIENGEVGVELVGTMLVDVQTCSAESFEGEGLFLVNATSETKEGAPLKMRGEGKARFSVAESVWQAPGSAS